MVFDLEGVCPISSETFNNLRWRGHKITEIRKDTEYLVIYSTGDGRFEMSYTHAWKNTYVPSPGSIAVDEVFCVRVL